MIRALIILHASPDAPDNRAYTAVRLAGAMMADGKDVRLFLVEEGGKLADPCLPAENPCRDLLYELMDAGLEVHLCGGTMRKLGWEEGFLLAGVEKSSMKSLSALIGGSDEVVSF